MTVTTAASACVAVGWPGAFAFAAFCLMVVGVAFAMAWADRNPEPKDTP